MICLTQKYFIQLFKGLNIKNIPDNINFSYDGENSKFYRINNSCLRQVTFVDQHYLEIKRIVDDIEDKVSLQLTGDLKMDQENINNYLINVFDDKNKLSVSDFDQSIFDHSNPHEEMDFSQNLFKEIKKFEGVVGILTCGIINSGFIKGGSEEFLWFSSSRADIDYSIFQDNYSVTEFFSLFKLEEDKIIDSLRTNIQKIEILKKEKIELKPGKYPVYLSPTAMNDIWNMMNWHGIQGKAFGEKQSAFMDLYEKKKMLNPKISLKENFTLNMAPKFNDEGEISDGEISLIENGLLITPLTNQKSAKKFGMIPNKANSWETLRSGEISQGNTSEKKLISELKSGIYISNVHYLNWSNQKNAEITGMTRFGCYFVDDNQQISPIKDMRFNTSFYDLFGADLLDLSKEYSVFCESGTYGMRKINGVMKVPGALTKMTFTL